MKERVLHVLEAAQFGTIRHVADVIRHVEASHSIVLPPDGCGRQNDHRVIDEMERAGAHVHLVEMRRSALDHRNLAAVRLVRTLIESERPHVVHGHSSIGGVIARLAAVGTGVARCYTPNGLFPSRITMCIERILGRITDRVIATSESEATIIEHRRLVPTHRLSVIPNGIDLDAPPSIDLRGQLELDESTPLVGTVGRLVDQKAPEVFVRTACARVAATNDHAHFVIVGDGPLLDIVTEEIATHGLEDRFHVVRMLSGGAAAIPQLDVFGLASRYEGGPYAPLEAIRVGVPVVLTDVVGNRDTVEDGTSGLLVPPEDPEALGAAISRLLDDADFRRTLGENGRRHVGTVFDVRRMADLLSSTYSTLARAPFPSLELRTATLRG